MILGHIPSPPPTVTRQEVSTHLRIPTFNGTCFPGPLPLIYANAEEI